MVQFKEVTNHSEADMNIPGVIPDVGLKNKGSVLHQWLKV